MLDLLARARQFGGMYTGLVERTGEVVELNGNTDGGFNLYLKEPEIFSASQMGDSIAVNGCCLTLAGYENGVARFDLLQETIARTSLGAAKPGATVNLERAMTAGTRFGGHFVQGHIDCTAEILRIEAVGADWRVDVALPVEGRRYLVSKGSIAVDGISLTVSNLETDRFTLWIIPHTWEVTNLRQRSVGDRVNLEYDMLAKHVKRVVELMVRPELLQGFGGK
jgi:riboflavin synthase